MRLFNFLYGMLRNDQRNVRIFFYITIFALVIPNIFLFFTEDMPLVCSISNVVVPLSVYWFLMTLTKKTGKMLWILFLFVFLDAFQLVLIYLFGGSVIAVDMFLNLVTTNSGEAIELMGNILPAVIGVIVIYMPLLVYGTYSMRRLSGPGEDFLHRQRKYAVCAMVAGGVLLLLCYVTADEFEMRTDIYPVNVLYNVKLAVEREAKTENYFKTSAGFRFGSKAMHGKEIPEIYVLVIGETARADNFGIYGYHRNTTPNLERLKNLVVFRDVLSQSNTTHKSVPMLLSAASAENYDRVYREKGVITAFKEAGYTTAFFSNQLPNHSFIDYFGDEAEKHIFIKQMKREGANVPDENLLSLVKEELACCKSKKLFIVLHMYGSHFNYYDRYRHDNSGYKPDSVISARKKYKRELVNAYDNTIVNTDKFLASLIKMVDAKGAPSAVIYTSDHGEDLYDDSRNLFLHASPIPSYYQLHVPYLVWVSESYRNAYPGKYASLLGNERKPVSSNLVTFHTMLDIGGISTRYLELKYSVGSERYCSPKRYYLNDHNLAEPMNEIGLKEEDEVMLRRQKMQYP